MMIHLSELIPPKRAENHNSKDNLNENPESEKEFFEKEFFHSISESGLTGI
jgi:hypothetical protein